MSDTTSLGQGLVRGGRRVVIHLLKAGVEVLRGVEGFFEELSSATHPESANADEKGPKRIPID
jgi:3-deoxy-D-manno-octulosonic acid (KDO) 8-phosphate synthase